MIEIDAYPPRVIAQQMGLADSTFRGLTQKVRQAKIPGFDHEPYNPVPKASAEIYWRICREKRENGFTWGKAIQRVKNIIFQQLLEDVSNV